jgi:hypothetical protein
MMNEDTSEAMIALLDARSVVDFFELLHDACLKNTVTVYTGGPEAMLQVAGFIKHLVTGFAAPAVFHEDNVRKIEQFLADDPEHLAMGLVYAMQVFKHGRQAMTTAIAAMMSEAWGINYAGSKPTVQECSNLIQEFPAALIVYMCMLFPNTSIGMLGQLMAPPTSHKADVPHAE